MSGMSVRDSLALSLTTMDYEKDDYNTPRIAAVTHLENSTAFLATIRKDALIVREFKLEPGTAFFVATYGKDTPEEANTDRNFDIAGPLDGCRHILGRGVFSDFEKPVTAACVFSGENGFELAVKTV
jgi:IMP cyclohydrolase